MSVQIKTSFAAAARAPNKTSANADLFKLSPKGLLRLAVVQAIRASRLNVGKRNG